MKFNHIRHDIELLEQITTPEMRLYKTQDGKKYPSVTSVTGLLGKKAIQEWRDRVGHAVADEISKKATKRGTEIHSLCEDYLNNKQPKVDIFNQEMFKSIRPELDKINNIHCLETRLYSDHLRVAGTVDCIAEYEGRLSVIDFKTSKRVKSRDDIHNYFMQCAAYCHMFMERTKGTYAVPYIVIMMAVDDDEPLIFREKYKDWIHPFIDVRDDYYKLTGK